MQSSASKKGPGRPAGDDGREVERQLIDAARDICIERGFDAASTKLIADRAGVNAAMINYYFGGKEGLGEAMMRSAIAPLLGRLDALAERPELLAIDQVMVTYMRTLAANPWLPRLVVREVLPSNGRFRELFVGEVAKRVMCLLPPVVKNAQATGAVDPRVDTQMIVLSLASLSIFPFLAGPIVEAVLGVDLGDDEFVERLVEHSLRVLQKGLAPEAGE